MIVKFTLDELRRWACAGIDRRVSAIEKGRKGAHGFNRDDFWQLDVEGMLAEAAVARALGIYFAPVTGELDTTLGDVLPGVQVRSTKYKSGFLLVHNTDSDTDRFILVTGASGTYNVVGSCLGVEGKLGKYARNYKGRTAFWVPQASLLPFEPAQFVR